MHTPHFLSENRTTSRPAKTLNISEAEKRRKKGRGKLAGSFDGGLNGAAVPTPPQIHDKARQNTTQSHGWHPAEMLVSLRETFTSWVARLLLKLASVSVTIQLFIRKTKQGAACGAWVLPDEATGESAPARARPARPLSAFNTRRQPQATESDRDPFKRMSERAAAGITMPGLKSNAVAAPQHPFPREQCQWILQKWGRGGLTCQKVCVNIELQSEVVTGHLHLPVALFWSSFKHMQDPTGS